MRTDLVLTQSAKVVLLHSSHDLKNLGQKKDSSTTFRKVIGKKSIFFFCTYCTAHSCLIVLYMYKLHVYIHIRTV